MKTSETLILPKNPKTVETIQKNQVVTIRAKEWFDKANGNSYFALQVWVNDEFALALSMRYGYGNQYEYEAIRTLCEYGLLPMRFCSTAMHVIARETGIIFNAKIERGCTKKEVKNLVIQDIIHN